MPGTRPALRACRAPPVPDRARTSTFRTISAMVLPQNETAARSEHPRGVAPWRPVGVNQKKVRLDTRRRAPMQSALRAAAADWGGMGWRHAQGRRSDLERHGAAGVLDQARSGV